MGFTPWRQTLPAVITLAVTLVTVFSAPILADTILPLDTPVPGTLAPTNDIYYTVTLNHPGVLAVSLTGWHPTLNWGMDYDRLYVYNSSGEPVGRNSQSTEADPFISYMLSNAPSSVTVNIGKAGTYTIKLHSGAVNYSPSSRQKMGKVKVERPPLDERIDGTIWL